LDTGVGEVEEVVTVGEVDKEADFGGVNVNFTAVWEVGVNRDVGVVVLDIGVGEVEELAVTAEVEGGRDLRETDLDTEAEEVVTVGVIAVAVGVDKDAGLGGVVGRAEEEVEVATEPEVDGDTGVVDIGVEEAEVKVVPVAMGVAARGTVVGAAEVVVEVAVVALSMVGIGRDAVATGIRGVAETGSKLAAEGHITVIQGVAAGGGHVVEAEVEPRIDVEVRGKLV
jgi:hypothetical protein